MSNQSFTATEKGSHIKRQNSTETTTELAQNPSKTNEHKDTNENQ